MKVGVTLVLAAIGAIGGTGLLSGFHMPFVSNGYAAPQQCVQWYDGCNMCQALPDGSVSCSDRLCVQHGTGFCRTYATSTGQS